MLAPSSCVHCVLCVCVTVCVCVLALGMFSLADIIQMLVMIAAVDQYMPTVSFDADMFQ